MMTQENIPYTADEIKAMVKTCEKYNKALKWMQKLYPSFEGWVKEDAEHYFPELIEDEDNRIRKAIIALIEFGLEDKSAIAPGYNVIKEDAIAWIEKQGNTSETSAEWSEEDEQMILSIEQVMNCASLLNIVPEKIDNIKSWLKSLRHQKQWKPSTAQQREIDDAYLQGICDAKNEIEKQGENKQEPVQKPFDYENATIHQKDFAPKDEPKFKAGNWISGYYTNYKVLSVNNTGYIVEDTDGDKINILFENEKFHHLFTIADAKDGDVLVNGSNIFIFHFINGSRLIGYCHVNIDNGKFYDDLGRNECFCLIDAVVTPATKEQRDQLEKAITEAGYAWDSDKKELKKIEPKTLDANKVIEWLKTKVYDDSKYGRAMIEQFKKDFEI